MLFSSRGWFTGSKPQTDKTPTFQPPEPMGCRFGLCDLRRTGSSVILSPDRRVAATSDALGRVMLIDVHKGVAFRIFKGYRDAHLAFIQVPDEKKTKHRFQRRVALFLIIYSPKKGTLEIFSAQQGFRIATFTAPKSSRLLYVNYGILGFGPTAKSKFVCSYSCVLIDGDGQIKEVVIPFHFALTEKNSKRARDVHLYKRLRHLIKSEDFDSEQLLNEVLQTCAELKTTEIKMQCLEMLAGCRNIPENVLSKCALFHLEKIEALEEGDVEGDLKHLKTYATNLNALLSFYEFASNGDLDEKNGNAPPDAKSTIGAKEVSNLQKLLDLSASSESAKGDLKVSFHNGQEYAVVDFLALFDLTEAGVISLKAGNSQDPGSLFLGAQAIFKNFISFGLGDSGAFRGQVHESRVVLSDLFKLLLLYWVNRYFYFFFKSTIIKIRIY